MFVSDGKRANLYGTGKERWEEEDFGTKWCIECEGDTGRVVIVIMNMSARVRDNESENVVGKFGVQGMDDKGGKLVDLCVENLWMEKFRLKGKHTRLSWLLSFNFIGVLELPSMNK